MKITAVRLRRVRGTMQTDQSFWEERLVRPVDVYPEYRVRDDFEGGEQLDATHFRITTCFVQIDTDDGVCGIAGPVSDGVAFIVATRLRQILLGQDPVAGEKLWDQMHRIIVHGRQGEPMHAISAVDCALWDLRGRWLGQPVYRLLGGPVSDGIPAYASMLGYAVLDSGLVRERALQFQAAGYTAQKWFFRHGPASGPDGLRKNVELVRTLREALGPDDDIMLDCWQSMDPGTAIDLASRIAEFRPRWLEECCMADRIDSYRAVKDKVAIPLAGAEHAYTRWGVKPFIDARALDILQPDLYWCGGLSEALKIAAYATAHDLMTIPHGSRPVNTHFCVTQSPMHTPYQEMLVKWHALTSHFLAHPIMPVRGRMTPLDIPGLGMDLDPAKIEQEEEAFA